MSTQDSRYAGKDLSAIPEGPYCYRLTGRILNKVVDGREIRSPESVTCPYWSRLDGVDAQESGYCALLQSGDRDDEGAGLLWDQVKACGVNEDEEADEA